MKWLAFGVVLLFGMPLLLLAPVLGILVDPFAPWRLSGQVGDVEASAPQDAVPFDPSTIPVIRGGVSDVFRYQLARAAGWNAADAILAVAISIAEDGSGNPTAQSPKNRNGTIDFCLWQVNSSWWPRFGGQQALADPQHCADAAHTIYTIQGWCAWSTYESACGEGHTSAYRAYLGRARAASEVQPPPGQA